MLSTGGGVWAEAQFPRLQKRGPIEDTLHIQGSATVHRFHAYKSVAPLKNNCVWRYMISAESVSTLTKAWPH